MLCAPEKPRDHVQPDYGRLHQELRRKGMTLMRCCGKSTGPTPKKRSNRHKARTVIGPGLMPSCDGSVACLSKVHHKRSRVPLRRDALSSTFGGDKLVLVSLTQIPG